MRDVATWLAIGRHVALATLAGLIGGVLVGGVLGRVAMRISGLAAGPSMVGVHTSNGNRVGDITLAGTIALIVFVGVGAGVLGGVVYAALEPWLRRFRPWHGVVYGAALLATFGFTVLDPFNFDFARFGPLPLNIAMFAALFVVFGVVTAWTFDRLVVLAAAGDRRGSAIRLAAWLVLGLCALMVGMVTIGAAEGDRVFVAVSAGALALAAIVYWRQLPRPIGYASLGALLVLGAARTFDGIQLFRGF